MNNESGRWETRKGVLCIAGETSCPSAWRVYGRAARWLSRSIRANPWGIQKQVPLLRKFIRERVREREREKQWFVVPHIYAFTGCFFYVPWPEIQPATLVSRGDALTHWTTRPGQRAPLVCRLRTRSAAVSVTRADVRCHRWVPDPEGQVPVILNYFAHALSVQSCDSGEPRVGDLWPTWKGWPQVTGPRTADTRWQKHRDGRRQQSPRWSGEQWPKRNIHISPSPTPAG